MMIVRRASLTRLAALALAAGCTGRTGDAADAGEAAAVQASAAAALARGDADAALRDYDRLVTLRPGSSAALKGRSMAHKAKGDYDAAIRDLDSAIAQAPNDARLRNDRGAAYYAKVDYPSALRDYDRAITLDSTHAMAVKSRGRIRFTLGDFPGAIADLRRGRVLDPPNLYVAIWLHMARHRAGERDTSELAAALATMDTTQWPTPIARHFLGTLSADSLMAAAVKTNSPTLVDQRCAVAFYLGEEALWQGRPAEAGRRFEATRATCPASSTEYQGAVAELGRLGGGDSAR